MMSKPSSIDEGIKIYGSQNSLNLKGSSLKIIT